MASFSAGFPPVNTGKISELELRVLEKLHKEYKNSGKLFCWKTREAYKDLGIIEGETYVGVLHSSSYIEVDGECLKIKPEGIRYMDDKLRKIQTDEEIVKLSPEAYGVGVNLKPLLRKIKNWFKNEKT